MGNAFQIIKESDGICFLIFDTPDKKVNVLDMTVMDELEINLNSIAQDKSCKGLIITSGKENVFIAGADISVINGVKSKQDGINLCEKGKRILKQIQNLSIPSVAAINGACLGGGMEFALFCSYRIASDNPSTKLGLPEVTLGILPGFGGTQLLPRLISLQSAIDLILSGRTLDAVKAWKIGLIDKVVSQNMLKESAHHFINEILTPSGYKDIQNRRKNKAKGNFLLEQNFIGKSILFSQAKKQILQKTGGNYPAPLKALDVIKKGINLSIDRAFLLESEAFGELVITPVCKNLIDIYYWSEKSKKLGKKENVKSIKKSGVLGAGVMGGGIAQLLSTKKIDVRMKDIKNEAIFSGLASAWKVYEGAIKRKKITKDEAKKNMFYISPSLDYSGFMGLDIVIEAIIEDIEVKKKVFKELEEKIKPDTIIASNTSSLSITKMSLALKNPERLVGLHFFNPVHLMPLIEIIPGFKTDEKTLSTVINLAISLGKMPVVVKDREGFLVNRILMPYLNEAGKLLDEGISIESIDHAVKKFGMPMGPLELMDEIGIDVGHKVAVIMENEFGKRMQISNIFNKIYEDKRWGKKMGKGFYIHSGKNKIPAQDYINQIKQNTNNLVLEENIILNRLIFIILNEALFCLEEKIVSSPSDLDFALVMGIGFPAFRGGILKYAEAIGLDKIYDQFKKFEDKYGIRYAVGEKLREEALHVSQYEF